MAIHILLLDSRADEIGPILVSANPDIEIIEDRTSRTEINKCEIWLGNPDLAAALLGQGYKPQWLQSTWAGYKPLLSPKLPKSYRLSRAVGVFGQAISEYVLAHMLAHTLGLRARDQSQGRRQWNSSIPRGLAGGKVLIVGAGEIGCEVATFLRPFGMKIEGIARSPRAMPEFDSVIGVGDLPGAASSSDFIINLLPDTAETADLYDESFFHSINPKAMFINAGRGSSVVDQALIDALREERLAWAVLDVFREEPLPEQHPFWRTPRLTITAHIAGPLAPDLMAKLFLENLVHFQSGEALNGEVDFLSDY